MGKHLQKLAYDIRALLAENHVQQALTLLREKLAHHPALDESILQSARYAEVRAELNKGIADYALAGLEKNRIRSSMLDLVRDLEREGKAETEVFISYSTQGVGKALAQQLHTRLEDDGYMTFLDSEDIPPGGDWAKVILSKIKAADYFVLLLSATSNSSEMVLKEVAEARRLKDKYGKPQILPIRVCWPEGLALNYKLQGWLNRLQHLSWEGDSDTDKILQQLLQVISQRATLDDPEAVSEAAAKTFAGDLGPPSPVAPLEVPRGAVRLESEYYIEREHEASFISRVTEPGALLRIRGPRQYGKTSLLARVMAHAKKNKHDVISIDFQDISEQTLANLESLIWQFCRRIAMEFDKVKKLKELWEEDEGSVPKSLNS